MQKFYLFLFFLLLSTSQLIKAQDSTNVAANSTDSTNVDTTSQDSATAKKSTVQKFNSFNKKMERLFVIIPVPIFSYSTEAGYVLGLAKFNLFDLSKNDTVSVSSKISELATFSTLGQVNLVVATELNWHKGRYMVQGYINYKEQPEYILGIGNDVSIDSVESIKINKIKFVNYGFIQAVEHLYLGVGVDLTDYASVETDSNSFLVRDNVAGIDGGTGVGLGVAGIYDSRDNRYNGHKGYYLSIKYMNFPSFLGNPYLYTKVDVDARTYFVPWFKHVIAMQATTSFRNGTVPFYELSLLGGEDKMRGYYEGALRDKVLVDCQIEYRMPVWNIFGVNAWIGTGRVAPDYAHLSLDGFWLSYGGGFRIKVDSKHDTNLRFDFGFGPGGISGTYINFAEAF
jgi:hypothetical protein